MTKNSSVVFAFCGNFFLSSPATPLSEDFSELEEEQIEDKIEDVINGQLFGILYNKMKEIIIQYYKYIRHKFTNYMNDSVSLEKIGGNIKTSIKFKYYISSTIIRI